MNQDTLNWQILCTIIVYGSHDAVDLNSFTRYGPQPFWPNRYRDDLTDQICRLIFFGTIDK